MLLDNSLKEWSSSGKGSVEVKPHPLGEEKYVLQGKTIQGWITFRVQIYPVYQRMLLTLWHVWG